MRRRTRWAILLILGSQAFVGGLAPVASSAPAAAERRGTPWRVARPRPETLAPAARAAIRTATERRLALRRAFPEHLTAPSRGAHARGLNPPWVTGRKPPLVAPGAARRLDRAAARARAAALPDTVRVLGIRVEFDTDSLGSQTSTPDGRFDLRDGEALGILIDPPPHNRAYFLSHLEALKRYYAKQSYGNLVLEYDVYPQSDTGAYRLGDTGRYGPWTLGPQSFADAQRFFREAVQSADVTDSIPFGDFDVVAVFHAGADFQSDIAGDSPRDIPTFQIALSESVAVNSGAVGIFGGLVMPETENQDGYFGALNGTLAHEFGHTQGLPDLYDVYTFFPAVGVWSNMDSGYLLATALRDSKTGGTVIASGVMPTSLDPWCRSLLWPDGLDFVDPGPGLATSLRASQLQNRLLYVPLDGDEYLLVENRQTDLNGDLSLYLDRDSTTHVLLGPGLSSDDPLDTTGDLEYDFLLPGQGILAWHVDPSVFCTVEGEVGGEEDVVCGPNANPDFGINSNPLRRGVAVVEADGIQDIGDPESYYFYGSPFDPYFVGNHTLLGPTTNPSTTTNDGAVSHVTLEVLSPASNDMDVTIASSYRVPGWPLLSATGSGLGAPTVGSLLHDGRRSLVTAADSLILAWMADGRPYFNGRDTGEFMPLPGKIRGPVLFVDSLYFRNPTSRGAGVVATAGDGNVYAVRPDSQVMAQGIKLFGWPPILGDPSIRATTGPVLTEDGNIVVGTSDGRAFAITPADSFPFSPLVGAACDTLLDGGTPVVSEVVGNLAVGRFHGAGGYSIAFATADGHVRVVDQPGKGSAPLNVSWRVTPGAVFAPTLLGLDLDRRADRELEVVLTDGEQGVVHAFDLAGAELPGWPVQASGRLGAPAAGDLDGDGYPEVLAVDERGMVHRWNRNGIEPLGWPVSLASRFRNTAAGGGSGSPVVADLDGDGRQDVLVALDDGLLVALDASGRTLPGWPLGMSRGEGVTPLLTSLNGSDLPPDPPGRAWFHVVGVGDLGQWDVFQLETRADSVVYAANGAGPRSAWTGLYGNRRRSAVLDDAELGAPASPGALLARGTFYCFPNPARGADIGIAYTLGAGVTAVEIRVLDPSGLLVRTLSGTTAPAQNVATIPLQNLASGVYLVRIEATRGGTSEVAFQKFAVVR